jgi:hypothetical protein
MVNRAGVLLEPRELPCDFFLWGCMKDLVYSVPIDAIGPETQKINFEAMPVFWLVSRQLNAGR